MVLNILLNRFLVELLTLTIWKQGEFHSQFRAVS